MPKVIAEHPDTKWRVIIQHYPAYSSVKRYQEQLDSWVRRSLAYICADNDIDLVISGHDAVYSRSAFMNRECARIDNSYDYASGGTAVNPEGTLYVVCGSSSGSLYQKAEPNDNLVCQIEQEQPLSVSYTHL